MLSLLDDMEEWALLRPVSDTGPSIVFRRGRIDVAKLSADVSFASTVRLGSVAVWETGELEAEILEIESEDRVFVLSAIVRRSEDIVQILDRVYEIVLHGA